MKTRQFLRIIHPFDKARLHKCEEESAIFPMVGKGVVGWYPLSHVVKWYTYTIPKGMMYEIVEPHLPVTLDLLSSFDFSIICRMWSFVLNPLRNSACSTSVNASSLLVILVVNL